MAEDAEVPLDRLQDEIRERVHEAGHEVEEVESGRLSRQRYLRLLAGSTAAFAVLAAIAALASGSYANEALFKANESVLSQAIASDTWAEYQADGIKRINYENEALTLRQLGAPNQQVEDAADNAKREGDKQAPLRERAEKTQEEAGRLRVESLHQLEHHHRFSYSVTLFQVAIGLAALAALVNIQPVWWLSLVTGLGAIMLLVYGFWPIRDLAPRTESPQGQATPHAVRTVQSLDA